MKKNIIGLLFCFFLCNLAFSEAPYTPMKVENGWSKSIEFDISDSEYFNTESWIGEIFAYEAQDYLGDFSGYLVAVVNTKDQECYYTLQLDKESLFDILRHYQTNYIYIDELTSYSDQLGDLAVSKMYEDENGNYWKLYTDVSALFVLLDPKSDIYQEKVIPEMYKLMNQDNKFKSIEEFKEVIPLVQNEFKKTLNIDN